MLDSEEINAFTTGGGYVYITRGIMNYLNSEAELAAVLGHEIGHVTARHPVRQQTSRRSPASAQRQSASSPAAGPRQPRQFRGRGAVAATVATWSSKPIGSAPSTSLSSATTPRHMIDVVRLLKNQEMFEIQRAREEKREPRVYHGVFSSHPDNDQRLQGSRGRRGEGRGGEQRPIPSATST